MRDIVKCYSKKALKEMKLKKISGDFYARHYTVMNGLFCFKSRNVCCGTIMYVVVLLCNMVIHDIDTISSTELIQSQVDD